jgi:hypothetical protein
MESRVNCITFALLRQMLDYDKNSVGIGDFELLVGISFRVTDNGIVFWVITSADNVIDTGTAK